MLPVFTIFSKDRALGVQGRGQTRSDASFSVEFHIGGRSTLSHGKDALGRPFEEAIAVQRFPKAETVTVTAES
jgi:hypothetical protein